MKRIETDRFILSRCYVFTTKDQRGAAGEKVGQNDPRHRAGGGDVVEHGQGISQSSLVTGLGVTIPTPDFFLNFVHFQAQLCVEDFA